MRFPVLLVSVLILAACATQPTPQQLAGSTTTVTMLGLAPRVTAADRAKFDAALAVCEQRTSKLPEMPAEQGVEIALGCLLGQGIAMRSGASKTVDVVGMKKFSVTNPGIAQAAWVRDQAICTNAVLDTVSPGSLQAALLMLGCMIGLSEREYELDQQ